MINLFKVIAPLVLVFFFASCSQVLETVELKKFSKLQLNNIEAQDEFDIELKTLTLSKAKRSKLYPYDRNVMVDGIGERANVYSETTLINSKLPKNKKKKEYILGIGDEISFAQYSDADQNFGSTSIVAGDLAGIPDVKDKIVVSKGRIGSDGSILILGLGRLEAAGLTLRELRSEARNVLIRKGLVPNFQMEISGFNSQKAYIFGVRLPDSENTTVNKIVPITDRPLSLKELAVLGEYASFPGYLSYLTLTRDKQKYIFTEVDLFDENRDDILIQNDDHIKLELYAYKPGKVYALSGSRSAEIIPINPSVRETLADALFIKGGPLSNEFAKRSEVYLLRGQKPVTAFHLNAQDASRILIASAMELRPDDIIYVAQRPIISFSRLLMDITPLRLLLRDIRQNNIP